MSEIRVDTISEKTSANGVAIDSVTLKDGGIAATAASTITTSDNATQLTLKSTDADAAVGPVLTLHRESSSPADDDIIGRINFIGEDSGGTDTTYGRIETVIMQESNGSEDATMEFRIMKGGTERNILELDRSAVIINEDSQDIDFRVESNGNTSMLHVDAGNDRVGIGTASPATQLHVANTGGIELRLDADTDNSGQEDCFIKFSTDGGGQTGIAGMDNNNSSTLFSGNTENAMVFGAVSNLPVVFATNNTERMQISADGEVTKPAQPAFQVHPASSQTDIASGTTIAFGTERFDLGGNFASNTFTAPVTGKYQMNVLLRLEDIDTAYSYFRIYLNTSNKQYEWLMDPNFSADLDYLGVGFSILVDMDASDTSTVSWEHGSGSNQVDIAGASMWTGYLVC